MKEIVTTLLLLGLVRISYAFGKAVKQSALVRMKLHSPDIFERMMDRLVRAEWMVSEYPSVHREKRQAPPTILVTRWLNPDGGPDLILPGHMHGTRGRAEKYFPPPALLTAREEWMTREAFEALEEVQA